MPDTSALGFYLPTISCTDRLGTIHHERLCSCLVPDKKYNSNLTNGARQFYTLLNCSQSMTQKVRDVVNGVLQRNGFIAHSENILISMVMDEQEHVPELAWRRILKC